MPKANAALFLLTAAVATAGCDAAFLGPTPGQPRPNGVDPTLPGPSDPVVPQPVAPPEFAPAPVSARVLLPWQYTNAVRDLLGAQAAARVRPPPAMVLNGFASIGASQLSLTSTAVAAYEDSAQQAAAAGLLANPSLVGCTPASPTDQLCYGKFVQSFGRRAFRRALTPAETTRWVNLGVEAGNAYSDFGAGARHVIAGMLQSPNFLYLPEVGAPDPAHAGWRKLTGLEIASRLSFLLSGSIPDEMLLAAAEAGTLNTPDGIRAHAQRLIALPPARDALHHFFGELFELDRVKQLSKDSTLYPDFDSSLALAMAEETRRLVDDVVFTRGGDVRELYDAPYTFVNAALNQHYGLGAGVANDGTFQRVDLPPASRRGGIFGQGAFLSLNAHPASTSPTHRGKFVREKLLCQPVGAPPNNVNTSFPEDPANQPRTMREKLIAHRANLSCAACHTLMDDIGLGLENFNAVGAYRDTEVGKPIDASANVDGKGFTGARELGTLLRDDPGTSLCLVKSLFRFSTGHVDRATELRAMLAAHEAFKAQGYRFDAAVVEIVTSDAFRYAGETSP